MSTSTAPDVLSAPLRARFDYTRSVGPVIGRFLTELRARRVVGIRGSDGRVLVPPAEYDPVTTEPLTEFVDVSDTGTVATWTWVRDPLPGQPFDRPFAWALIKLDGADTTLLHAVDVASPRTSTPVCACESAGPTRRRDSSPISRVSSRARATASKALPRVAIPSR